MSHAPTAPPFALGRCPYCASKIKLRTGRRFRCGGCQREFDLDDVRPRPEDFGLASSDADRFMSTPQMHAGLRAAFLALTAAFSVAVCAVEHGSVGLCLFVGLLGGLFGGELIAAKLEKPVCKSIERRRQRAEVYPNFLRWRSAVEAYEAFHRAVIAEEQRVLEEKRRSEEEEERRRDEERRERGSQAEAG